MNESLEPARREIDGATAAPHRARTDGFFVRRSRYGKGEGSAPELGPENDLRGDDEIMRLRDYIAVVRDRRWLIAGITLLVTAAVVAWTGFMPDYYESKARVEVKPESVEAPNPASDAAYLNTQLQLINSPEQIRRIVNMLQLEKDPVFVRHMTKGGRMIRRALRLFYFGPVDNEAYSRSSPQGSDAAIADAGKLREAERLGPVVSHIQRSLTAEQVRESRSAIKDTRLVEITYRHASPRISAAMVNAAATAIASANTQKRMESSSATKAYLTRRAEELHDEIRKGEEQLNQYANQHDILSLDPGQNTAVERLLALNKQLVEAENERKAAEANYRLAMPEQAAVALAEGNAHQIGELEKQLVERKEKRAALLVGVTEKWPGVQELNQQISTIESQIAELRQHAASTLRKNLETKFRQAAAHEQAIAETYRTQRAATVTQNEAAVNYRLIRQQIDSRRKLLDDFLKRLGEEDVVRARMSSNISIVQLATVPDVNKPDGPFRLLYVLLAFVLSFSASVCLVLIRYSMDDKIRSSADVRGMLDLRPLADIPAVTAAKWRRFGLFTGSGAIERPRDASALLLSPAPPLALAEQYRRLRTALLSIAHYGPGTLLVTSTTTGEGTTTTAVNLGKSLAQIGSKVVIVDGNLRKPALHQIFGIENRSGLSSVISGDAPTTQLLEYVHVDAQSGIALLPAGPASEKPAELLGSERMPAVIDALHTRYSHVIIDSPSVTSCADALVLSSIVDGVLLVVSSGRSTRDEVKECVRMLEDVGGNLLGVVLNNVAFRPVSQEG